MPPKLSQAAEDWKWKVDGAADTLLRAQELTADTKLHKAALAVLKKRQKALDKVVGSSRGAAFMKK